MSIFLIADTHFYHTNIIRYSSRPFATVEEMNEKLIENWNNVVSEFDTVYHLGDLGFFGNRNDFSSIAKAQNIVGKLNGNKYLILGNHDNFNGNYYTRNIGFKAIIPSMTVLQDIFILSHSPAILGHNLKYINIHGHIHNKNMNSKKFFNVSVENISYTPINIEMIKELCKNN